MKNILKQAFLKIVFYAKGFLMSSGVTEKQYGSGLKSRYNISKQLFGNNYLDNLWKFSFKNLIIIVVIIFMIL